jgi:hypothetical protein
MAPLSLVVLTTILAAAVAFWIFLSVVKTPTFAKLRLS